MKIIDNFLPKEIYTQIYNRMIYRFPWFYTDRVTDDSEGQHFLFQHFFVDEESVCSDRFDDIILPLLGPLTYTKLLRVKANCYTRTEKTIEHNFHTDHTFKHTVGLYSINTNNGYTLFEDGTKVESVANRMCIFDGLLKHKSCTQTDEKLRLNINFNYI